ncbi:UNVERIFIED_CONTAM: LEAF RUST 10 DISEASE-RESISTANCE LOCUS RECEPTOR-LIKE PROTEIN KINASE-like 2.7 [Sesamum radiatum]|uniref:LEAF RUST 10 DISEASE-RESISTANCE LOCUS RECEPTOR-LIKE PROTEIN KINASE-like 2.7 n=1 Tax=Sesamum radiatum TaxID=300843 RepID=A0AAW2V6H0_SESRA
MHSKARQELFLILLALATLLPLHFPASPKPVVIQASSSSTARAIFLRVGNFNPNPKNPPRTRLVWGGSGIPFFGFGAGLGQLKPAPVGSGAGYGSCLEPASLDQALAPTRPIAITNFPLLNIPPLIYRVLEFDFSNRTLKVARQDLLDHTCPTTFYDTTLQEGPYQFAPDSKLVTLFFDCVVDKNGELTSLPYLSGCINLFTTGDAASGPGPNITCSHSISVPVNQTAAQALDNPEAASNGDVLREALAHGFLIRWSTSLTECTFRSCKRNSEGTMVVVTTPSPVYQEEPIAMAVIGTGVVILYIILCCYLKRLSRLAGPDEENIENFVLQHGSLAPKRYKYSEIKKITKSFKDKLGQGGFGSVYQGMLPDGSPVAAKVLINSDRNGEEFINEVASISRTSHVNY